MAQALPDSPRNDVARLTTDVLLILAVCLVALTLRLKLLPGHDVISTDGTGYVNAAREIAAGNLRGFTIFGFYPVLIRLSGLFGCDMETGGRLISIFFGTALIIPLFLLGRSLFGRPTALAATLLTSVSPPLVLYSCEVMTQALYTFLTTSSLLLVLRMIRRPSAATGMAAGICLALAYLTRPEGFLLFFTLPLVPIFLRRGKLSVQKTALAAYVASFLLLFLANLVLIRETTGFWQLSAKTGSALNDSLVFNGRIANLSELPPGKSYGYLDVLREYPDFIWLTGWKNLKEVWHTLVPVTMWCLALFGIVRGRNRENTLFLLTSFAPLCVIIAFYYVGSEYTQPYLPALFLFISEGGVLLERQILAKAAATKLKFLSLAPLTLVAVFLYAAWLFIQQIPAGPPPQYSPESDGGRRDYKNIGLLLKKYLPPGKIMTPSARIAYYAERERVAIPEGTRTLEEALKVARANNARFLVLDGWIEWDSVQYLLAPVTAATQPDGLFIGTQQVKALEDIRLRPYLFYRDPSSRGVAVYEILP